MSEYIGGRTQSGHMDGRFRSMNRVGWRSIRVQVPITDIMKPKSISLGMSLRYNPQRKLTCSKATSLGLNSATRMSLRWNPCTSDLKAHTKATPDMLRVSNCDFILNRGLRKAPKRRGKKVVVEEWTHIWPHGALFRSKGRQRSYAFVMRTLSTSLPWSIAACPFTLH